MQIPVVLDKSAADLLAEFGAGAKVYVYGSPDNVTYSAVTSAAIVTGTDYYELYDAAGVPGTTWYKFHVGDSLESLTSQFSDPWLSTSLTAYATVDDVDETMNLGDGGKRLNLISDQLVDVSMAVDVATGRQFYRSPQVTGTETFYIDVLTSGTTSLAIASDFRGCSDGKALDIVSVTTLEVRDSETSSYTTLTVDSDFFLMQGRGPGVSGIDWPFEDIERVSYTWPTGLRAVRITGVRGFPRVPTAVKRAVVSEVRNRIRGGIAGGGAGPDASASTAHDDTEWQRIMSQPYKKPRPSVA